MPYSVARDSLKSSIAVNIEHKSKDHPGTRRTDTNEYPAERTNAFVTLVFGYSVLALLFQNKAAYGINAYLYLCHSLKASRYADSL